MRRFILLAFFLAFTSGCDRTSRHAAATHDERPTPTPSRWVRTYGGSQYDAAHGVIQKKDGTFIVVGETASHDGDVLPRRGWQRNARDTSDLWILHLDAAGNILQQQTLGGRQHDVAYAVAATTDGGYVVAGATCSGGGDVKKHHGYGGTSDFWVLKFDASDTLQWQKTIGGARDDGYRDDYDMMSIVQADDGGYVLVGNAFSDNGDFRGQHHGCPGTRDIMVVKLDANGRLQWTKALGGTNHEYVSQIVKTPDRGYLIVGRTESFDGDVTAFKGEYDAWVVKIDEAGALQWQRTLGGEMWDWGSSIAVTPDGGSIFAGYTYSWDGDGEGNHGDYDYFVVKLAADGRTEWRKVYGGLVDDFAHSIVVLRQGGYLVIGGSTSRDGDVLKNRGNFDVWAIRLDEKGSLIGQTSIGGSGYDICEVGASTMQTADGDVVIVGTTKSNDGDVRGSHGDYDALVIKLSPDALLNAKTSAAPTIAQQRSHGGHPIPRKGATSVDGTAPRASRGAPAIEWSRALGGSGADRPLDSAQALATKKEGGCVLIGSTQSKDGDVTSNHGGWDVWVVNLNDAGHILWQKTFGGSGNDTGAAITQASDGGFAFVATTDSKDGDVGGVHGMTDFWVVRLDATGRVLWKKTLGGSGPEIAYSIAACKDGGFVVGGYSQSHDGDVSHHLCAWDFWIVKLDANGKVEWDKSLGGTSNDYLTQIIATRDGGFAAIGRTESDDGQIGKNHGTYDYWVVKLDRRGELEWEKTYGSWDWEWGNSIAQTRDGGYILGGYTYTFDDLEDGQVSGNHGEFDYWVVKIDADGELQWEKSFGGANYELGYGIVETRDGGYAMIGGSPSTDGQVTGNHGNWDYWVIKTDRNGKLLWEKSLGGSAYDAGYAIAETHDGGLLLLGESLSQDGDVKGNHGDEDIWLVKLHAK